MSHQTLRQDKNCLNCGHEVDGRYCPQCGQENVELHHSSVHLIIHYLQDLVHYDGHFWHTVRNLFTKPGLVAKEFIEGKRKQNLEPIRFYVFASTVFFIILFYVADRIHLDFRVSDEAKFNYEKRLHHLRQEKEYIGDSPDTVHINQLLASVQAKLETIDTATLDSIRGDAEIALYSDEDLTRIYGKWLGGWLEKAEEKRKKEVESKYEFDAKKATISFLDEVFHKTPQLLFLSMPFFAFYLKLMYTRSKRRYVDHFIFSIYHYAYSFVLMSFFAGIDDGV